MMDHKKIIKMKLITWIVLAVFLIFILVLSILYKSRAYTYKFNSSFSSGQFSFDLGTSQDMKVLQEYKVSVKDIAKINVDLSSEDINIFESEDQNIYVVEKSNLDLKKDQLCKIRQDNHQLNINKPITNIGTNFFALRKDIQLDIYLPSNYEGDILLETKSGDLTILSKLDLKDNVLEVYHASGDIEIENEIRAGKVIFDVKSGDIDVLKEINTKEISMISKSGNITLDNVVASESYSIEASSGNISMMSLIGKGKIGAKSGNVSITIEDIKGDIYCETMSGNIDLGIDKNINCELYAHCKSGDINSDIPVQYSGNNKNEATAKLGAMSNYKIDIKATSGNIHLVYK